MNRKRHQATKTFVTRSFNAVENNSKISDGVLVSYDEHQLERVRTQWQFGDWETLKSISRENIEHHPERAKLALLCAAGHLQDGKTQDAYLLLQLARDWGCQKNLILRILAAGVHNSLGRASYLINRTEKAANHFTHAIKLGSPGSDSKLLANVRLQQQLSQLGFVGSPISIPTNSNPHDESLSKKVIQHNKKLKDEIKTEIEANLKANNPNPYAHNRTLTPNINKEIVEFAKLNLGLNETRTAYIDYLGNKALQIEKNCVGRLATTIQDAIIRQLVAESVNGDKLTVLEIGALYGIGLAIIYNHAVTRYSNVNIICLDPFDGYYGQALDALLNQPVNDLTFKRNMLLANVPANAFDIIKEYSTKPEAITKAAQHEINLLVIDGDHSYEGVKADFENYFPLVVEGGYVIFDDYNAKEWPGVQKFIDEDLSKHTDFEYLGFYSRTAVGRKRFKQ